MKRKNIQKFLLSGAFLLLSTQVVQASPFYGDIAAQKTEVIVDNLEINPMVTRLKLGYEIDPVWSVEAHYGKSAKDDSVNSYSIDVAEQTGLYIRYATFIDRRLKMYLLLGVSEMTLDGSGSTNAANNGELNYRDTSYSIGLEERMHGSSVWSYIFEYTQYYKGESVEIKGMNLGLRYDF